MSKITCVFPQAPDGSSYGEFKISEKALGRMCIAIEEITEHKIGFELFSSGDAVTVLVTTNYDKLAF